MNIYIDDKWTKENNITIEEVLAGLLCRMNAQDVIDKLIEARKLVVNDGVVYITQGFNDMIDSILLSSNPNIPDHETLFTVAKKLRKVVPQIPKKGTPYYYVCNNAEVTLSLQRLFYYYGSEFNKLGTLWQVIDVLINTTKTFYNNFNDDNAQYFPLLKYFIIKVEGDDVSSPLMSEIEMIRDGTK